jgi:hypothetical protein
MQWILADSLGTTRAIIQLTERRRFIGGVVWCRQPTCARRANQASSAEIIPVCPAFRAKIFIFVFSEAALYSSTFRTDTRGVRVVTNVERNAVDVEVP